ncbi:alanyl-tRNA synthetase [Pedobacter nutrimenti]|jgi:hypothetical protein|nr:alanyl-tRNA synthetase [Pedobacter nutrimenti]
MEQQPQINKKERIFKWVKKIGIWGFLFFLVKGLIWLALGYWVFK